MFLIPLRSATPTPLLVVSRFAGNFTEPSRDSDGRRDSGTGCADDRPGMYPLPLNRVLPLNHVSCLCVFDGSTGWIGLKIPFIVVPRWCSV